MPCVRGMAYQGGPSCEKPERTREKAAQTESITPETKKALTKFDRAILSFDLQPLTCKAVSPNN